MKIRNVSGDDRIVTPVNADPFLVAADETVDVDHDLGVSLLEQEDVWQGVGQSKKPTSEKES